MDVEEDWKRSVTIGYEQPRVDLYVGGSLHPVRHRLHKGGRVPERIIEPGEPALAAVAFERIELARVGGIGSREEDRSVLGPGVSGDVSITADHVRHLPLAIEVDEPDPAAVHLADEKAIIQPMGRRHVQGLEKTEDGTIGVTRQICRLVVEAPQRGERRIGGVGTADTVERTVLAVGCPHETAAHDPHGLGPGIEIGFDKFVTRLHPPRIIEPR